MAEGLHRQIRGKGVNNVNNGYHIFIYIFTNLIGYIFDENPVAEVYTSAVEFVFYACGSPQYFVLFLVAVVVNVALGYGINAKNSGGGYICSVRALHVMPCRRYSI